MIHHSDLHPETPPPHHVVGVDACSTTDTPATGLPPIIQPGWDEIRSVAALVADAFYDLPVARWLVAEPEHRATILRDYFTIVVQHAYLYGHLDILTDRSAVAVWLHRTQPIPPPPHYEQRKQAACGPYAHRFSQLDTRFGNHHPKHRHHHLALIAVAPTVQGTGRASRLLAHHHTYLDNTGTPAYLEASSVRSSELYLRHGYDRAIPFNLPNGILIWPMHRTPRPTGTPPQAENHTTS